MGGRTGEARVAVEATPRSQADEDLARAPFEPLLQLDGIVASVEDEQGGAPPLSSSYAGRSNALPARLPPRWRLAQGGRAPRPRGRPSSRARN